MSDIYHNFIIDFFTPNTFNNFTALLFFFSVTIIFIIMMLVFCDNPSTVFTLIFATTLYLITSCASYVYGVEKNQSISLEQATVYLQKNKNKDCPTLIVLALTKKHQTKLLSLTLSDKVLYQAKIIKQYWGKQIVLLSYLENKNDKINEDKIAIITTNSEYDYLTDFIKGSQYNNSNLKNQTINLYNYGMNGSYGFLRKVSWDQIKDNLID